MGPLMREKLRILHMTDQFEAALENTVLDKCTGACETCNSLKLKEKLLDIVGLVHAHAIHMEPYVTITSQNNIAEILTMLDILAEDVMTGSMPIADNYPGLNLHGLTSPEGPD